MSFNIDLIRELNIKASDICARQGVCDRCEYGKECDNILKARDTFAKHFNLNTNMIAECDDAWLCEELIAQIERKLAIHCAHDCYHCTYFKDCKQVDSFAEKIYFLLKQFISA